MSAAASTPIDAQAKNPPVAGRLFFLNLSAGLILSANPDGSDLKTIINEGRKLPDGLALDVAAGHIYWTNMGDSKRNDGSIMRSDLNGQNMITIVPSGRTFTPKQLQLEKKSGKLYWSDREGMRVMRVNLDGAEIETLVALESSEGSRRGKQLCPEYSRSPEHRAASGTPVFYALHHRDRPIALSCENQSPADRKLLNNSLRRLARLSRYPTTTLVLIDTLVQ